MRTEFSLLQISLMLCGTISAVRINIPAGILFIKNVLKHFAVVNSGIRNLVIPDDLVLNIDLNMILITEIIPVLTIFKMA